ncbi:MULTISPECIES: helix-turn-helix domain-containing protein [unclassified Kribbella]|uniref:helix-turn-helix transcriptional regulator n=1 Tax=unclassified Kribbella TaxID=2644121 RepID=UPI0033DADF55
MDETRAARIAAVAALEEPTRRRLYEYVVRQAAPVTRDEAAAELGLARATAAFHLDRLADEGLLAVVFERRTGRSGPGAGRPSKLYCRSDRQIEVSLPDRRYELAGRLLAAAIEDNEATGEPSGAALNRRARQLGSQLAAGRTVATGSGEVLRILEEHGFEPRVQVDEIVLGNCPFHALAQQHTTLVCAMNLCLIEGLLTGLHATELQARLEPEPGQCCVRLTRSPASS